MKIKDGTPVQAYLDLDTVRKIDRLRVGIGWSRAEVVRIVMKDYKGTVKDLVRARNEQQSALAVEAEKAE